MERCIYSSNPFVFLWHWQDLSRRIGSHFIHSKMGTNWKDWRKATRTLRKLENITSMARMKELGSINFKKRKSRNMICNFRYRPSQRRKKKNISSLCPMWIRQEITAWNCRKRDSVKIVEKSFNTFRQWIMNKVITKVTKNKLVKPLSEITGIIDTHLVLWML